MNTSALIGHTGFVGSTLKRQTNFTHFFRSSDIQNIKGMHFDTVVCAGAPAQKWLANKEPEKDRSSVKLLTDSLKEITCEKFILISTVDVFPSPVNVNEDSDINEEQLHPYGANRLYIERFVKDKFGDSSLIVRLPGLVGPGLKKNIIFDFLNNNNLGSIDHRNKFQFYPMVNLWSDIKIALTKNIDLLHLTSAPISVSDVAIYGFGMEFSNELENPTISYDFQSKYADIFNTHNAPYQYSIREELLAIRAYSQSEPITKL